MAMPATLGWLIYEAAAYLVRYSSIEIRLYQAGFGFVSNAAEMAFQAGPVITVAAALVFGLLGGAMYLRRGGSLFKALAIDLLAAAVLLSAAGSTFLFPSLP